MLLLFTPSNAFLPFSKFSNDMMLHIEQILLFVYVSSYRELIAQSKTTLIGTLGQFSQS